MEIQIYYLFLFVEKHQYERLLHKLVVGICRTGKILKKEYITDLFFLIQCCHIFYSAQNISCLYVDQNEAFWDTVPPCQLSSSLLPLAWTSVLLKYLCILDTGTLQRQKKTILKPIPSTDPKRFNIHLKVIRRKPHIISKCFY